MAVAAAPFVTDPIGSHIPFFEHVDPQAKRLGMGHRIGVNTTRITIKNDVGHALVLHQRREPVGPLVLGGAKRNIAGLVRPECTITCIEPDTPHLRAGGAQHFAQLVKKRAVRALQKQENLMIWCGFQHNFLIIVALSKHH